MTGPDRLRKYLTQKRLTHAQLAAEVGIAVPMISMWVSGRRHPNLESAFKIERATGGYIRATDWLPATKRSRAA